MGQLTFDTILHLAEKGYTVIFRKSAVHPDTMRVIRVELRKGDNHTVCNVDLSGHSITTLSTDSLVAKGLQRALLEYECAFEGDKT